VKLNFTISELIASTTAAQYRINNYPDVQSLDNLLLLIVNCLQPCRELLKRPMIVTSGYRCKLLNQKVGGSSKSEHLQGKACDFIITGMNPADIVSKIRHSDIEFNQLIEEHGANGSWVHISYNKGFNRKEVLRYKNGIYTKL